MDLINLYAQKLGVEVEFKQVEWAALIPGLTSGDTDVVADSLTRTVPRSASLNLSNPFFLTGTTALLRADEENLKTWEDLNSPDVKLGITEGTVYADTCAELFPEAEILTFQSKTEWFEALKPAVLIALLRKSARCWIAWRSIPATSSCSPMTIWPPRPTALPCSTVRPACSTL